MTLPIYLDYAATTPIDPRVLAIMQSCLQAEFGNPTSSHAYGRNAAVLVETARQQVADLVHANAQDIIWTSGATEANNLALKGIAHAYQAKGRHIVTCKSEHSSVLDSCAQLEREGFAVTYLTPQKNGLINLTELENALRADTILISIMHANNETGVVQDIAAIGALARAKNILLHVDAVQSAGKLPIDLRKVAVDLMVFSAHKLCGPKGIGALYVKSNLAQNLVAQIHGGGQEQGLRSGTLAVHQIVGMGAAFHAANIEMQEESKRVQQLRDQLWHSIESLGGVYLNGDHAKRVPGILNVTFVDLDSKILLPALRDLAVSTGSACHAPGQQGSHVLRSMRLSDEWVGRSIRFSLGRFTTIDEINQAIECINTAVNFLRGIV